MTTIYEQLLLAMGSAGIAPTHLAAHAPGVGKDYGTFSHKHGRLLKIDPQRVQQISVAQRHPEGSYPGVDGVALAILDAPRRSLEVGWIPAATTRDGAESLDAAWPLLVSHAGVGYSFRYEGMWHPANTSMSILYDPTSGYERGSRPLTRWLHDIFPDNYLSAEYLDAPVGFTGRSLWEWIEADEGARGTLRPYTDTLVEWRPPVARIPAIREELYRMGRVFHRAFVEEQNFERGPGWIKPLPNPLYRPDQFAAWEAPDGPVPERFRADSYPVTDDPQRVGLLWFDAIRPREQGQ